MNTKIYISTIIISLILFSCNNESKNAKNNISIDTTGSVDGNIVTLSIGQYKNADIKTQIISDNTISELLTTHGFVTASPINMRSVSTPIGGFIKNQNVTIGTPVHKGQALASLEDEQYIQLQQDYLMTKANIRYTAQDLDRQQALNASKAVSDKQYQQAIRDYQMDKIKLQSLAAKLRLIHIDPNKLTDHTISNAINLYAPISGYISKVNYTTGSFVSPSIPVYEIINNNDINIVAKILEKDIHQVSIGQRVTATHSQLPDKQYFCTVRNIEQEINPERTVDVLLSIHNPDPTLKHGMYMTVNITTSAVSGTRLPNEAIIRYEGRDWIFIERASRRYEMMPITVLTSNQDQAIIAEGTKVITAPVVINGAYTLLMALKNVADE